MKKYTLNTLSVSTILFFALPFVTFSQEGSLDNTFGSNGIITTAVGDFSYANATAIQADGKIVAAGTSSINNIESFTLTRYNTNGSLDATFGTAGIVTTSITDDGYSSANAVAIQADGKIVVAGSSTIYEGSITMIDNYVDYTSLIRYNTNGSLDLTFGLEGIVLMEGESIDGTVAFAVALQADGKIVLAGSVLTRHNTNGSLDTTFGNAGIVTSIADDIAIQADGKIVAAGTSSINNIESFTLTRYNTNGSLDGTFGPLGTPGIVTTSITNEGYSSANAVAIQADGKIVVAGYSVNNLGNTVFALSRHNTNGSLDTTFGTAGVITTNLLDGIANDISIQADGKIVVAGFSSYNGPQSLFSLTRYNTNGSLDNTFGNVGIVTTSIGVNSLARGIALQTDGKIVVTGGSDNTFAVVRYNNSLTGDISENSNNTSQISIYPNPFSKATTLKTDNLFENATFIVYNTLGEQVRKIDNISGQTFTFYRENLEQGIYFYHLKENNKMLSEDKLIICD